MELELENYTAKQILSSYEFVFAGYLGGQLSPPDVLDKVPTVYIFGEICAELRKQYLSRKDAVLDDITSIEKSCINRLSQLMNIPENKLQKLYEQMVIQSENHLRKMGEERN